MARLRDPQQHRAPDQEGGAREASGQNLLNGKAEQAEVIENQARHELAHTRAHWYADAGCAEAHGAGRLSVQA